MNIPIKFKCDCGEKWKMPFPKVGEGITCSCKQKYVVTAGDFGEIGMVKVKGEIKEMNIKAKLIGQLEILESLQILATKDKQFDTSLAISGTILDYIRTIDMVNDEEPDICPDCEEAELEAMMINDIADEAGVSTLIVKAVLDAQSVVLDLD